MSDVEERVVSAGERVAVGGPGEGDQGRTRGAVAAELRLRATGKCAVHVGRGVGVQDLHPKQYTRCRS